MPRGDGTGPTGMGAMTGRGAGFCAGNATGGHVTSWLGRAFGRGRGMGFRRGYGFPGYGSVPYAAPTAAQEVAELTEQSNYLSGVLESIKKRIATLRVDKKED